MDKENNDSKKKSKWWICALAAIAIVIIILLLLHCCGNGKKRKIVLHYGDEVIEVDTNFKISDLEVDGGTISFLVDSDGHIVDPDAKLDPSKEYSAHIIPEGKISVKVTYKEDNSSFTVKYQKGAGLLLPKDPSKKGYVFVGWQNEATKEYPAAMTPVNEDMTLVAVFEKSKKEDGKCTLNCDTNKDGACDLNCDKNGDGKPDSNIDTDGDGKPDTNIDKNHDNICDLNCDTNGDGKPNTNIDTDGDGLPDLNNDENNDGICDYNCDTDGDDKCDKDCVGPTLPERISQDRIKFSCDSKLAIAVIRKNAILIYLRFGDKVLHESDFTYNAAMGLKVYDYSYLLGSGKTIYTEYKAIKTDDVGQKYYYIEQCELIFEGNCDTKQEEPVPSEPQTEEKTFTLTYNANGGKVSPSSKSLKDGESYGSLPTPTRSGYTFAGWYNKKDGGNKVDKNTKIKDNTTIYAHWTQDTQQTTTQTTTTPDTPKQDDTDNGTIKLSASSQCLISGQRVNITATVSGAKDSTIDWKTGTDRCITINGSGTEVTVTGDGCGNTATIKATLKNENTASVTLTYENKLVVTLIDYENNTPPYRDGDAYKGVKYVRTNIPAVITGTPLDESNAPRTQAYTSPGADATVTVKTPCGQSKTYELKGVVN